MWAITSEDAVKSRFTWRKKLILVLFVVTFPIMVWALCLKGGVSQRWRRHFNVCDYHHVFNRDRTRGIGEKGLSTLFVNGASSLVGVSLIIGLARGLT